MTLQLGAILILNATQILSSPGIDNLEASFLQLRNLAPNRCPLGSLALGIKHQHYCAGQCGRWARPILSRVLGIKRPVWVVSPLVRVGRPTDRRVLIEGEEVFVFKYGKMIFVKLFKLNYNVRSRIPLDVSDLQKSQ